MMDNGEQVKIEFHHSVKQNENSTPIARKRKDTEFSSLCLSNLLEMDYAICAVSFPANTALGTAPTCLSTT